MRGGRGRSDIGDAGACTICLQYFFADAQKNFLCIHVHTLVHVFFALYMDAYVFALPLCKLTLIFLFFYSSGFRSQNQ